MTGHAAIEAACKIRKLIFEAVGRKLSVAPERLRARDGRISVGNDPATGVSFAEAAVLAESMFGTLGAVGSYTPPRSPARWKGSGVGATPTYSYSAAVVELTVDRDTGVIHVDKIWIAHDVGKAINPLLAIGQIEGSVYMGLGEVLMEEQVFRRGVHKLPSMLEYKSPTTLEMPPVDTILVETLDPAGPYGAKECGQGPLLPVIPAVANALFDALGVRIDEVPITPEKVLAAMEGRLRPQRMPAVTYPPAVAVSPLEPLQPAAAQEVRG
jgi:CO/xanthine dehydrogenase Mo-binding subunit